MIITIDPWLPCDHKDRVFNAQILATNDIKIPLKFEGLRKAECLVGKDFGDKLNIVLLLQSETDLWAVSLTMKKFGTVGGHSEM